MGNRCDAEDLANEILVHALDGVKKYQIVSLDAWVWRIAYNRYARYCEAKRSGCEMPLDEFVLNLEDDYDIIDEVSVNDDYQSVFRYLHTLSSEYRDILVDYYIGDMPVKVLAKKYLLSESAIKWRLNVSRQKIKNRMGENKMDKVYKRINWCTDSCNGSMDSNAYLSSQVARAICEAAYEKPLTVEEISLKTGLPTLYIEDTLPYLIYGDAIEQIGSKYATNFIILRLNDRKQMETQFERIIGDIAKYYTELFTKCASAVAAMGFFGHDFTMSRLGYIALPLSIREKVKSIKKSLPDLESGPFPPRKDGGYGWFIVEEAKDENDKNDDYGAGCNISDDKNNCIYWFNIAKYSCNGIYNGHGTRWLAKNKIPQQCKDGLIPSDLLTEDDIVQLLQVNLITKVDGGYKLNFACFTKEQFTAFASLFKLDDERIHKQLSELILSIKKSFVEFVPKRLGSQINQWVSCFVHNISGYVTDELIANGTLQKPDDEKPLTDGVFYIEGKYVNL